MSKTAIISVLSLIALTSTASAYDGQSEIDRREWLQEQRIQNARRSGELTRSEYRQLEAEQARVRQMERNALRDGHIDRHESAQIRRAQNEASRHIYQESHDGERRGYWGRRWW
jgi:CRISPR/Cas system-associated endoribonuclease Cas2